jgi:hypothetical protein
VSRGKRTQKVETKAVMATATETTKAERIMSGS